MITGSCTLAEALADGEINLVQVGETIASMFAMSMKASKSKSIEAWKIEPVSCKIAPVFYILAVILRTTSQPFLCPQDGGVFLYNKSG